jgi:nucleoside 2-deoxyribosyltransferase
MKRVYTASKLTQAELWNKLQETERRVFFHARWLKHIKLRTPDTPEHATEFWLQDELDVKDADAVIVYAEGEDRLRGALVEAGMAIAYNIPVIVVGDHADYGTWQYHHGVHRVRTIEEALEYIQTLPYRGLYR